MKINVTPAVLLNGQEQLILDTGEILNAMIKYLEDNYLKYTLDSLYDSADYTLDFRVNGSGYGRSYSFEIDLRVYDELDTEYTLVVQ